MTCILYANLLFKYFGNSGVYLGVKKFRVYMKQKFFRSLNFNKRAKNTLKSVFGQINGAETFLGMPLENATVDDLQGYIEYLREKGLSESSISLAKAKLRQFYIFCFEQTDDLRYRKPIKALKGLIVGKSLDPQNLLTPDDTKHLINVAGVEQDKAIVSILWESGMRVGEMLSLTNRMIQMKEREQEVTFHIPDLEGCKTGKRTVLCVEIYNYVEGWMKCQLDKSPDANFIQLEYRGILRRLEKLFQRAQIHKPCNPHIFRHSAITHAVNLGMQQNAISARFWGHVDSNMLKVYISLSDQMQADAYKSAKGMKEAEVKVVNPLASRCIVCGRLVQSGNKCPSCSDIEALQELVEAQFKRNEELKTEMGEMKKRVGELLAELHGD